MAKQFTISLTEAQAQALAEYVAENPGTNSEIFIEAFTADALDRIRVEKSKTQ